MGQILGPDNIPTLTTPTSTTVTLAAANAGQSTTITVGGQQYTLSSTLTLTTTASVGAGALDTGTIASATTYYVYVIVNSSSFTPALIGSLNAPSSGPTIPTGYLSAYKLVGGFITSASSTSISSASGASANIPGTLPVVAGAIDLTGHWNIGQTNTFVTALNVNGVLQVTGFGGSGSGGGGELYLSSANAGGTGTPTDWRFVSVTQSNNTFTANGAVVGDLGIKNATTGTLAGIWKSSTGALWVGQSTGSLTQTTSTVSIRATTGANFGNSLEWGHPNQAGYASVLGYNTGGGTPFIGFSVESDANNSNKYTTRGFAGNLIYGGLGSGIGFAVVPTTNASNQSATTTGSMNNVGSWTFGSTTGGVVTNSGHTIQVTAGGGIALNVINAAGATPFGMIVQFSAASPNNGSVYFFRCLDNATDRLLIYSNGGIANFSANNSNLSDQRIKTNITTTPSQLDFINALQVKDFEYLDSPGRTVTGLIAQDVQALDPTLVSENGGEYTIDGYTFTAKTIHESQIYYKLLKAVQELSTEVTTLKARIDGYGIP